MEVRTDRIEGSFMRRVRKSAVPEKACSGSLASIQNKETEKKNGKLHISESGLGMGRTSQTLLSLLGSTLGTNTLGRKSTLS